MTRIMGGSGERRRTEYDEMAEYQSQEGEEGKFHKIFQ